MTVFTPTKQNNHDYSAAEAFGELDVLFPLGINITNVDLISQHARDWFKNFDFQEDHFLPIGNPVVVAVMTMCLLEEAFLLQVDEISLLEWDKQSQAYVPRTFVVSEETRAL